MKSDIFNRNLGVVLAMLAIVAMLGSACGPSKSPPAAAPPPTPGGNQPPVISSLTAAQMQTHPSGAIEIQCVASDPDGDKISFKWAATGGDFTNASPTIITWKAPKSYGDYDITVTVEDGKGGTAQETLTLSVMANQPPQISLDADPKTVLPKGSSTITCIATDPDGDAVRYSWSASDGSISGVGDKVTWSAPNKDGNFDITVLVSDGKGNETTGNIMITVSSAIKTVTISPIAQETGTVSSDGDKDTSRTMAGDDENNTGYRAFWSFNIYSLVGAKVKEAKIIFTTKNQANDPFSKTTGLGGLLLWQVNYGEEGLPNFDITGGKLGNATAVLTKPPTVVDVTSDIQLLIDATSTRFQIEAQFVKPFNGNGVAEWMDWSEVVLEVTFAE